MLLGPDDIDWHLSARQVHAPAIRGDISPQVKEENYVDDDAECCCYPHENEVGSGTLDRILNPAPYTMTGSDKREISPAAKTHELTKSRGAVKVIRPICGYIDPQ